MYITLKILCKLIVYIEYERAVPVECPNFSAHLSCKSQSDRNNITASTIKQVTHRSKSTETGSSILQKLRYIYS